MPARSKVAMLPEDVRTELESRIVARAFSGYHDLAEWLHEQGYEIAHDSVQRHGSRLQQKIETMERLADQTKAITTAAAQTDDKIVDVTMQLIHQQVLSMVLQESQRLEEADTVADPSGAASPAAASSLNISNLMRLTRIVTDLSRVAIARQQQAEKARASSEQNKHSENKHKGKGLSEETYNAIRNTLLGINPFAKDAEPYEGLGSVGLFSPGSELRGQNHLQDHPQDHSKGLFEDHLGEYPEDCPSEHLQKHPENHAQDHPEQRPEEHPEDPKSRLDADRRTSTPKATSYALSSESIDGAKTRLRCSSEPSLPTNGLLVAPDRSGSSLPLGEAQLPATPRMTVAPHGSGWMSALLKLARPQDLSLRSRGRLFYRFSVA